MVLRAWWCFTIIDGTLGVETVQQQKPTSAKSNSHRHPYPMVSWSWKACDNGQICGGGAFPRCARVVSRRRESRQAGRNGEYGEGGPSRHRGGSSNLRSLLARESLEDNLGVAVDFKVVDGGCIGGRVGAVGPLGQLLDELARGPCLPCDSLHGELCVRKNAKVVIRRTSEERGGRGQ